MTTEAKRIESENALDILSVLNDYAWSFDWDKFSVSKEEYGYCCDTGGYNRETELENLSEVYWTVVNFAGDSKRPPNHTFVIEWSIDSRGVVDRTQPITVSILDHDMPEPTNRVFTISKQD